MTSLPKTLKTFAPRAAVLAAACLVAACAVGPRPQGQVGTYDFGPPAAVAPGARLKAVAGIEVVAPRWLDSTQAHYRLAYANAAQPMAYAQTRWVMPPPVLIEARARERAVAQGTVVGGAGALLRIELDEFAQVFDSEKTSRAVLRARATLQNGREVLKQRRFVVEEAAPTPDGPGGAAALARGADRLIESVLDWAGGG